jgi:hypothetical protein
MATAAFSGMRRVSEKPSISISAWPGGTNIGTLPSR